jgi:hypothetical protein
MNDYVHTASSLKGAGGSFPGLKCPRCEADHLPPSGAEPGQLYIHSIVCFHSRHKDNVTVIVPTTKRQWSYKKHFQNYVCSKDVFIAPLFFKFCIANKACVGKNRALLGYYAASSGNFLLTFQSNQSVPSSGVKNPTRKVVTHVWCYYKEERGQW